MLNFINKPAISLLGSKKTSIFRLTMVVPSQTLRANISSTDENVGTFSNANIFSMLYAGYRATFAELIINGVAKICSDWFIMDRNSFKMKQVC